MNLKEIRERHKELQRRFPGVTNHMGAHHDRAYLLGLVDRMREKLRGHPQNCPLSDMPFHEFKPSDDGFCKECLGIEGDHVCTCGLQELLDEIDG